jgi:hypothetical protein
MNMMPTVCLSSSAFPIVTSTIMTGDNMDIPVQLPIISGALGGTGRIVCFSQLSLLLNARDHVDTGKLLARCLSWLTSSQPSMAKLYLIGFDSRARSGCTSALRDLGLFVETRKIGEDMSRLRGALLIPSTIAFGSEAILEQFKAYVRDSGNGIAIFYVNTDQPPTEITPLLQTFGLSFTGALINEGIEGCEPTPVCAEYEGVSDCNLVSLLDRMWSLLDEPTCSIQSLNAVLQNLRYHILCLEGDLVDQLPDVCVRAFDFLKRTNCSKNGQLFPEVAQALLASWLVDVYAKLKPETVTPLPEYTDFPGVSSSETSEFEMDLIVRVESWAPTGLWLPAGTVGEVELAEVVNGLHVQVGSHTDDLSRRNGPYRRWPSVILVQDLNGKITKLASPFGGIVYLANHLSPDVVEPARVRVTFRGFCRLPVANRDRPELWTETKDLDVPWGEIVIGRSASRCQRRQ